MFTVGYQLKIANVDKVLFRVLAPVKYSFSGKAVKLNPEVALFPEIALIIRLPGGG